MECVGKSPLGHSARIFSMEYCRLLQHNGGRVGFIQDDTSYVFSPYAAKYLTMVVLIVVLWTASINQTQKDRYFSQGARG